MTPARLKQIIAVIGRDRTDLARMLGYASENSLRQAEDGKAMLTPLCTEWLERYGRFWERHAKADAEWLKNNPPPDWKNG